MTNAEILLLGDGSHAFRTMGWVLDYRGLSIKSVSDPEAALEALVHQNFDLIIARVSREQKDNLTVLRQARQINPSTRVILIASSPDPVLPLEAYTLDISDYIIMPISAGEFWRRVKSCLEGLVVDLTLEDSSSQSTAGEKLSQPHSAYDPVVSAAVAEMSGGF